MRIIISALIASVIVIGTIATAPASAGRVDGWFTFSGTATKTRTFNDGSARRTSLILYLQKKANAHGKCRAQITVRSGGYVWRSKPIYKYTRHRTRGYVGVIGWPNRARRTSVTVKTNGRCAYRIYAR